jgi:hypothetical protein
MQYDAEQTYRITRRMQLTGWGCGGGRKINRLFELPLPAADAQTLGKVFMGSGVFFA